MLRLSSLTLEHLSTVMLHRTVVLVNDATLNCDAILQRACLYTVLVRSERCALCMCNANVQLLSGCKPNLLLTSISKITPMH